MNNLSIITIAVLFAFASLADAFVPPSALASGTTKSGEHSKTSLGPKFLKDLGFEKPSWLPDFGGGDKKEEEEVAVAAAASDSDGEGTEEAADDEASGED